MKMEQTYELKLTRMFSDTAQEEFLQPVTWRRLGSPKYVASPMVDASDYAFRSLVRRYGAHLCFTPMLHARMFVEDKTYRRQRFDIQSLNPTIREGPTIAQLAGDDPNILLEAGMIAQQMGAAGIDINLGCPQPIARKGHYGSSLLRETDLIVEIVRRLSTTLSIPVSCKIRILDEGGKDPAARGLEPTIRLAEQISSAGASFLTVHGRNRIMTGKRTGPADWLAIAAIKSRIDIPVIANGNIEEFDDVEACLQVTGADAVMSAEALLENPALFSGNRVSQFQLAREYLDLVSVSNPEYIPIYDFNKCVKAHIARFLYAPIKLLNKFKANDIDDHSRLISSCVTSDELLAAVNEIEELSLRSQVEQNRRMTDSDNIYVFGHFAPELSWYRRHRVGSIEVDREKRKREQELWLESGLRMTR